MTGLSSERKAALIQLTDNIRRKENFLLGFVGGSAGALLGAAVWAGVSAATGFQIGYMAIGIGWLVGYGVRTLGSGMSKPFGYLGAALSLGGCLLGNFGALVAGDANASHVPFLTLLAGIEPTSIPQTMIASFQPMDLLFYGIALYFGFKFSMRRLTKAEIAALPA